MIGGDNGSGDVIQWKFTIQLLIHGYGHALPIACQKAGAITVNGKILIFGGYDTQSIRQSIMSINGTRMYGQQNLWAHLAMAMWPYFTVKIWVLGGKYFNSVEIYDDN